MMEGDGRMVKSSARNRREKENSEFSELGRLLPLPYAHHLPTGQSLCY